MSSATGLDSRLRGNDCGAFAFCLESKGASTLPLTHPPPPGRCVAFEIAKSMLANCKQLVGGAIAGGVLGFFSEVLLSPDRGEYRFSFQRLWTMGYGGALAGILLGAFANRLLTGRHKHLAIGILTGIIIGLLVSVVATDLAVERTVTAIGLVRDPLLNPRQFSGMRSEFRAFGLMFGPSLGALLGAAYGFSFSVNRHRVATATFLLVAVTLVGATIWTSKVRKLQTGHIAAWRERQQFEMWSIRALEAAADESQLRKAVGDIGLFLPLVDGEWIAICYGDSHIAPGWSSAVALDSGGELWTSEYHLCRRLEGYSNALEQLETAVTLEERKEFQAMVEMHEPDIGISTSTSLSAVREALVEGWGFQKAPRRPTMIAR
jgi:hypothetical protein